MIVICDENKIISLAGILGGKNSCCDHETKNILIESAYFLPDSISSTGRKLNIQSDADTDLNEELTLNQQRMGLI